MDDPSNLRSRIIHLNIAAPNNLSGAIQESSGHGKEKILEEMIL